MTSDTTFTLPQLALIRQALTELGATPQPFGYAIAKNLRRVTKILDTAQDIGRDFMRDLAKTHSIDIVVRKGGEHGPVVRAYDPAQPLGTDEGAYYDMTNEQRATVKAFDDQMNAEPHRVEWHVIPEEVLQKATLLPGNALVVLCEAGIIIEPPTRHQQPQDLNA